MIDDHNIIQRTPDLITADVEGESVVLNSVTGTFYQLNASAARIWDLVETPQTPAALVTQLVARFDVTAEQCRADVLHLIDSLQQRGLVKAA